MGMGNALRKEPKAFFLVRSRAAEVIKSSCNTNGEVIGVGAASVGRTSDHHQGGGGKGGVRRSHPTQKQASSVRT